MLRALIMYTLQFLFPCSHSNQYLNYRCKTDIPLVSLAGTELSLSSSLPDSMITTGSVMVTGDSLRLWLAEAGVEGGEVDASL
jgi:hypothetical protein